MIFLSISQDIDDMDKAALSHFDTEKPSQMRLADLFKDKVTEIQSEIYAESKIAIKA